VVRWLLAVDGEGTLSRSYVRIAAELGGGVGADGVAVPHRAVLVERQPVGVNP
jgi:hypothetical protein